MCVYVLSIVYSGATQLVSIFGQAATTHHSHFGARLLPRHSKSRRDLPFGFRLGLVFGFPLGFLFQVWRFGGLGLGRTRTRSPPSNSIQLFAQSWEIVSHCLYVMREIYGYDRGSRSVTSPSDIWLASEVTEVAWNAGSIHPNRLMWGRADHSSDLRYLLVRAVGQSGVRCSPCKVQETCAWESPPSPASAEFKLPALQAAQISLRNLEDKGLPK